MSHLNELTVVIICKNQQWNIERLIRSVLAATATNQSAQPTEVVVVDSASTDQTVAIAQKFPVRILKLSPDQPLCAAIGRLVGYEQSRSRYVLFLDGDMEMWQGWLEPALAVMRADSKIAVVSGDYVDLPVNAEAPTAFHHPAQASTPADYTEVRHGRGAALYCCAVLKQVGPFDARLTSEEEPDLCLRIRHAGYRVVRLNHQKLANHYTHPTDTIPTLVKRWQRRLFFGGGQNLRVKLGGPLLVPYIRERGFGILPLCILALGILALLVLLLTGNGLWMGVWLGAVGLVALAEAVYLRSLYRMAYKFVQRFFLALGTLIGFLMGVQPETHTPRFTILQPQQNPNASVNPYPNPTS